MCLVPLYNRVFPTGSGPLGSVGPGHVNPCTRRTDGNDVFFRILNLVSPCPVIAQRSGDPSEARKDRSLLENKYSTDYTSVT